MRAASADRIFRPRLPTGLKTALCACLQWRIGTAGMRSG